MKQTITGYIIYEKYQWDDKPTYRFSNWDNPECTEFCLRGVVMEHSFEVDVPENFDPTPGFVAQLKAEKTKLKAEFSARVMELDAKINSLLAIEA